MGFSSVEVRSAHCLYPAGLCREQLVISAALTFWVRLQWGFTLLSSLVGHVAKINLCFYNNCIFISGSSCTNIISQIIDYSAFSEAFNLSRNNQISDWKLFKKVHWTWVKTNYFCQCQYNVLIFLTKCSYFKIRWNQPLMFCLTLLPAIKKNSCVNCTIQQQQIHAPV